MNDERLSGGLRPATTQEIADMQRKQQANGCTMSPTQVPLRERMQNRMDNASNQHESARRVLEILSVHPEFDELIELLDLINRNGY